MTDPKQMTFDDVENETETPTKVRQTEMVLQYLERYGTITPVDAMREFGIMRLASRISDLKRAGFDIKSRMKQSTNRFGKPVHYAEYYVGGDDNV